jgi:hypothetical protein
MRAYNSYRAGWVQSALGLDVGGMGLFGGIKRAKVDLDTAFADKRVPPFAKRISTAHTRFAGSLAMLVFHIYLVRNIAQIAKTVVAAIPVDVVNGVFRPLPSHMQPSKATGGVLFSINTNPVIPVCFFISSDHARFAHLAFADAPRKNPRIGVVVKKFAQAFCGKIGFSHDAVLSLCGQRPGGASTLTGPRHFNTGGA